MRDDGMTDDRDESPIDYSSLGPPISSARFDALVANIGRAAQPELQRRREQGGLLRVVVAWRKPLMLASGLAAAAGLAVMLRTSPVTSVIVASRDVGAIASDTLTIATALGIPVEFTTSVEGSTVTIPETK